MFTDDHLGMYCPAAYSTGPYMYELSWDDYIHRYVAGKDPDSDLELGITDVVFVPRILKCPADRVLVTPGKWYSNIAQRRTYSMVSAGTVGTKDGSLPPPKKGVGIYYSINDGSRPDWSPRGYRTDVIQDPVGTILLVEQPKGGNIAGNDYPSFCLAPEGDGGGNYDQSPYQIDTSASGSIYGQSTYGLHSKRFDYLFHDQHVASLRIENTIGTGTLTSPKGMWTMTKND